MNENAQLFEILDAPMIASWMFELLFAICELGERVTIGFESFGDELERCDWYKLPTKMQRMHLMFLVDTQQPVNIECFGNILCTRDTFKKVFGGGDGLYANLMTDSPISILILDDQQRMVIFYDTSPV